MTPLAIRHLAHLIATGGLLTGLVLGCGTFRNALRRGEESRRATGRFRLGAGGGR